MPGFVNIGAWVGARTMVDTWATVGSCAQIGADVHLSGGVGIGGVLEPPQARPVDRRGRSVHRVARGGRRGRRVGEGAVVAPNVVLSASIPVIDVTGAEPVEHRGYVPPRSVVLPGTRPKAFPAGTYDLPCALIVGTRSDVDRSQDVAQRRPPRVRDRDMRNVAEVALFTDDVSCRRGFLSMRWWVPIPPRSGRAARSSQSGTRRSSSTSVRPAPEDGPPNEDHFALSVADLDATCDARACRRL